MAAIPGTPRTWVAGEYPTAAQFNAELRDSLNFLANPPACRVYHTVAQSISHNTVTALAFNSERYDWSTGMHDTATNNSRITIVTGGIYVVTGNITWAAHAGASRILSIRVNGTAYIGRVAWSPPASEEVTQNVSTTWRFAAADYVELTGYQFTGGVLNVQVSANVSPEFSATWVSK